MNAVGPPVLETSTMEDDTAWETSARSNGVSADLRTKFLVHERLEHLDCTQGSYLLSRHYSFVLKTDDVGRTVIEIQGCKYFESAIFLSNKFCKELTKERPLLVAYSQCSS